MQAAGAFPARVGIGEMHADIAERDGPEQSVGDGVGQHIGVRVAFQSEVARDGDAAQDQRPAGYDAMDIPTLAHAALTQWATPAASSSARNSLAKSISGAW